MTEFTVITKKRVLRVKAASQKVLEAALTSVGIEFQGIAADRPKGGNRRGRK